MIEWAMLFALGALAASLVWLLVVPVLSRRAVRRARALFASQMPMSMAAINAEKDRIRADHATDIRRLERGFEIMQARLATLMGDNGRQVTALVAHEAAARRAGATIAALEADLDAATKARHTAEGTLGTQEIMLHDALARAERVGDRLAATEARLGDVEAQANERRATIAALETRATGEDLRLRAALARAARLTDELAAARTAMDDVTSERDIARVEGRLAARERDALKARVDELVAALAAFEGELETARQANARSDQRLRLQAATIDGLADRVMIQDTERDALHRLLDEAHARRDALHAERGRILAARGSETPDDDAAPPTDAATREAPAAPRPDDRATRLRAAVAALAADLVVFATEREAAAPPLSTEGGHPA